jgi:hypothetical protein
LSPLSRRWFTRVSLGLRPQATLQMGSRPTSECFLSSDLSKARLKTSLGWARNGSCSNAGLQHSRGGDCLQGQRRKARKGRFGVPKLAVFVLDEHKKPLMPCSEKRARPLVTRGRAVVHRRHPFSMRLKAPIGYDAQPVRVKIDPGSKSTRIVVTDEDGNKPAKVLRLFELSHLSEALTARRAFRRRRGANLRYQAPRFDNRRRSEGWLAPSLQRRVDTWMSWVGRLRRWAPVSAISVEPARFDAQALENPEISGLVAIKAQLESPLKDAAANATRWALYEGLATGLSAEASSGRGTKYNRSRLGIPKARALDAACVAKSAHSSAGRFRRSQSRRPRAGIAAARSFRHTDSRAVTACAPHPFKALRPQTWCRSTCRRGSTPASALGASPFGPAALSESARPTESTPSTANFFTARTATTTARPAVLPGPEGGGFQRGRL